MSSKTRPSDSSAFNSFHVIFTTVCTFAVKEAVFLHQIAAVEMKQLVPAVIFRGADSPAPKVGSEVMLAITASNEIKKGEKKQSQLKTG